MKRKKCFLYDVNFTDFRIRAQEVLKQGVISASDHDEAAYNDVRIFMQRFAFIKHFYWCIILINNLTF